TPERRTTLSPTGADRKRCAEILDDRRGFLERATRTTRSIAGRAQAHSNELRAIRCRPPVRFHRLTRSAELFSAFLATDGSRLTNQRDSSADASQIAGRTSSGSMRSRSPGRITSTLFVAMEARKLESCGPGGTRE